MSPRVLVIGAGPVGLIVALELARYGIPHKIIEANPNKNTYSKALSVSAASLKAFHGLGLAPDFAQVGKRITAVDIYFGQSRCARINKRYLSSCYNYYLSLSQPETEAIIERQLISMGTEVQYGCALVSLSQNERGVETQVANSATNTTYTERYDIVVGCDGAQSTTRQLLGLSFTGSDYDAHMIMGDVYFEKDVPTVTSYHIFEDGFLICLPMAQDLTRIVVGRPGQLPKGRRPPQAAELQGFINRHLPAAPQIREIIWSSSTRFYSRIAETNTVGRVYLAGDAFHLFSPIGGQGMNTGVQDAINLGWKIALTLQGKAKPTLLGSYENERYRAVHRVLASTHRNTLRILQSAGSRPDERSFEVRFDNRPLYRGSLPQEFSGLEADHSTHPSSLVGRHVPYFSLKGTTRLPTTYDIPGARRNVVIVSPNGEHDCISSIHRRFETVLDISSALPTTSGGYHPLGLDNHEVCLVRPDGYVGYLGSACDLNQYLEDLYV